MPWLAMPPPATAVLPLTVQLVSVLVDAIASELSSAAAVAGGGVAADGAVGQRAVAAVVPL